MNQDMRKRLANLAYQMYAKTNDDIQIDDNVHDDEDNFSEADDYAWVKAWVRVPFDEADLVQVELDSLQKLQPIGPIYDRLNLDLLACKPELLALLAGTAELLLFDPENQYVAFTAENKEHFRACAVAVRYEDCVLDFDKWETADQHEVDVINGQYYGRFFGSLLSGLYLTFGRVVTTHEENLFGHFVLSRVSGYLYFAGSISAKETGEIRRNITLAFNLTDFAT